MSNDDTVDNPKDGYPMKAVVSMNTVTIQELLEDAYICTSGMQLTVHFGHPGIGLTEVAPSLKASMYMETFPRTQ